LKKFDYFGHTADIGITAYGNSMSEAYANAAYGLFSIITDLRKVRQTESRVIALREDDLESLLFEWLNELIYIFEVDRILIKKCDIQEFGGNRIRAICRGEKIDLKRHRLKTGVKAATYHLLTVDQRHNRVQVIFDI
jgi:SHS2 domain-containing protein